MGFSLILSLTIAATLMARLPERNGGHGSVQGSSRPQIGSQTRHIFAQPKASING